MKWIRGMIIALALAMIVVPPQEVEAQFLGDWYYSASVNLEWGTPRLKWAVTMDLWFCYTGENPPCASNLQGSAGYLNMWRFCVDLDEANFLSCGEYPGAQINNCPGETAIGYLATLNASAQGPGSMPTYYTLLDCMGGSEEEN